MDTVVIDIDCSNYNNERTQFCLLSSHLWWFVLSINLLYDFHNCIIS